MGSRLLFGQTVPSRTPRISLTVHPRPIFTPLFHKGQKNPLVPVSGKTEGVTHQVEDGVA